jgi:hypothetical protein
MAARAWSWRCELEWLLPARFRSPCLFFSFVVVRTPSSHRRRFITARLTLLLWADRHFYFVSRSTQRLLSKYTTCPSWFLCLGLELMFSVWHRNWSMWRSAVARTISMSISVWAAPIRRDTVCGSQGKQIKRPAPSSFPCQSLSIFVGSKHQQSNPISDLAKHGGQAVADSVRHGLSARPAIDGCTKRCSGRWWGATAWEEYR